MSLADNLIAFAVAAYCAWSAVRIAQSGKVHAPFGALIATRSADPLMFWVYFSGVMALGAIAAMYGIGLV